MRVIHTHPALEDRAGVLAALYRACLLALRGGLERG